VANHPHNAQQRRTSIELQSRSGGLVQESPVSRGIPTWDAASVRIFHIATAADWQAALESGDYTTSTLGRTLAEEGFIHASRPEQVRPVWQAFYHDVEEPLVLLTIDTDKLDVPWREEPVGADTFPHVYGPLSPQAVVEVQPLDRRGDIERG
jgi:uncharacterized protein (DUF952 family)